MLISCILGPPVWPCDDNIRKSQIYCLFHDILYIMIAFIHIHVFNMYVIVNWLPLISVYMLM